VRVSINSRIEMPPSYMLPQLPTSLDRNENRLGGEAPAPGAPAEDEVDRAAPAEQDMRTRVEEMMPPLLQDKERMELDANSNPEPVTAVDSTSSSSGDGTGSSDSSEQGTAGAPRRRKQSKSNLKTPGGNSGLKSRRVSFDPLALLLDASLEGELELVRKTAVEVRDPSASNDEGITALHNAICAGHFEIVKFLVEFGCDVNSQDSDGWTPLHCAASCNNLPMVRFLVEHGACIFATTLSDHETAAEKCEEDEEGYHGCSEYLYSIQEKLGILNSGRVYAVFSYQARETDELTLEEGRELTVLRKGDEVEREWWWASGGPDSGPAGGPRASAGPDVEGYIPRNLLGLYPRVKPQSPQREAS